MRRKRRVRGGPQDSSDGLRRPWVFLLPLSFVCSLAACGRVAVPSGVGILRPRVSEGQEIRVGQRAARDATRTLGLVADQALQDYVQQVGVRLAELSDRTELPWTFRVVDDAMPNSFALPGGFVFVTRGLVAVIDSEAELAAVLSHEIAHVNARHGVQTLAGQRGPDLGVWAVPITDLRALDAAAAAGPGLMLAERSLEEEREADDLAFRYLRAAGYDVRDVGDLLATLGRLEVVGGRSALPSWLTSHPDPGNRAEESTRRVSGGRESLESLRQNQIEYLDQIEDLVYGQDPRQGFFREAVFVHPELRFRIQLPDGWRYRNLAQALVATSPDRDAAVQLTIAEQVAPAEAAAHFLAQPGVSASGGVVTDGVGGSPAASVSFRVTTKAGSGAGVAAWVLYGGRTYRIVGIGTREAANGHADAFRSMLRSFAPVNDPRLLDVRPNRINIVRLGRATTFADFNRRYPSAVGADEVALLNRVGPTSRLRAGERVKRVVKG